MNQSVDQCQPRRQQDSTRANIIASLSTAVAEIAELDDRYQTLFHPHQMLFCPARKLGFAR